MKKAREAHIFETMPTTEMNHDGWAYKIMVNQRRIGKLYRSRSAASRAAGKLAKKVTHWHQF